MKRILVPALSGLFILTTSACTSSTVGLGDRVWSGTWQGTGPGASEGTLTIAFPGGDACGTISTFDVAMSVHGPACATPEGMQGSGPQTAAELLPSVHFAVQIGASVYEFDGSRADTAMGGTYVRIRGSCTACDCGLGESGTWQVSS